MGVQPTDPLREVDSYCSYFDNQYGRQHPAFYRGRLQQVNQIVRTKEKEKRNSISLSHIRH